MTDRASCWSITINNPKNEEYQIVLPARWKLVGQLEKGEQGTVHFQGMLNTPQVRFAAVKRVFPRAHIEIARDRLALAKYVQKEDTRVAHVNAVPTIFEYQTMVASKWNEEEYQARWRFACEHATQRQVPDPGEVALLYVDTLVARDVELGVRGAEYIAINPMWRSSWKRFWRSIIRRNASQQAQPSPQADEAEASPQGSDSE